MSTKRSLVLRLVCALGLVLVVLAINNGAARSDIGEAAVAAVADKQRLVALGTQHSCAITDSGGVECWGNNDQGQLGNATFATSTTPQPVAGLAGVRQVVGGAQHTCALLHGGSVSCWGQGGSGQLGNDDPLGQSSNVPVAVTGLSGATAIAAGGFHNCALLGDGTVRCWGQDGMGQLGDETPGDYAIAPVAVPGITAANPATAIAAGEFHTCALLTDDTVQCWGANGSGQLGDGTTDDRAVPTDVAGLPDAGDHPALALTAGNAHTCAVVDEPNRAYCWGLNTYGQLGHKTALEGEAGHQKMKPSPTPLVVQYDANPSPLDEDIQTLEGLLSVSAGEFHTCALVSPAAVGCWGLNGNGQLGADPKPDSGDDDAEEEPYEDSVYALSVPGLAVDAVVAGGYHTCAVDGAAVKCWGFNFHGQLGSHKNSVPTATTVTSITGALSVAAGTDFACAITEADIARRTVCWGSNADGRLGAETGVPLTTVRMPVADLGLTADLDLGNGQACARPSGSTTLRCWGRNADGELGDGTNASRNKPAVSVADVTAYDAGGSFEAPAERGTTCAVRGTGKVSCWGENGHGQLGDNTVADSPNPVTVKYDSNPDPDEVTVSDLTGVADVAVGGFHGCALLTNGQVRCWGLNSAGQLGDNSSGNERHLAVLVQNDDDPDTDTPLTGVADLVAGSAHTCAEMTNGDVRCWGANGSGQLGDQTGAARADATKKVRTNNPPPFGVVGDLGDAVTLAAGDQHTCASREGSNASGGGVVCWGSNAFGQSGGGGSTAVYVVSPPKVDIGSPLVTSLAASRKNTCVTMIDKSVRCLGDNTLGQIGDGIGTRSIVPLLVGELPSVGGNHVPSPVNDTVETTPGVAVTVDALANDTDEDGQTLTLDHLGPTVHGTAVIANGKVEYTPAAGCQDETFVYYVTDGQAVVPATISVLMNCAPVAANDTATTAEDTHVDIDVRANDTDPENDSLTVTDADDPAHGTTAIQPSGDVRYTPDPDFCGAVPDVFGYTISDGHGHTASASVAVTVTCGKDGPAPGADALSTPEDTPADFDVLANDGDADGDPLTLVSVGAASHGTTSVLGNKVHYQPTADYCGPDSFSYQVSDGHTQAAGNASVTVTCAADSPRPAADAATTPEDTSTLVDVLANDTDPDGGALTLGTIGDPAHGTATAEAGKVRYAPDPDYCGADSFGYQVTSPGGAATGSVEISVTCVNDAPVAAADQASTDEDEAVHVHVLDNDTDVDGDTLHVTEASGASHGTLTLAINDAVAYTPDAGWCGVDDFTYTVTDSSGATSVGTVTVTVSCVNDPVAADPVANQTTQWGDLLSVPLTGSDGDDPPDPLSWSLVSGPAGASVATSGTFLWTPTQNQLGAHPVTVQVSDGESTAQRSFTVTVTRRATVVAYDGSGSAQTSDPAAVSALLTDEGTGQPLAARDLSFSLGAATAPATTGADGRAAASIAVTGAPGVRQVAAAYAGNAAYAPSTVSQAFTVTKESIDTTFGGQPLAVTAAANASVTLTAEIAEQADGTLAGALSNVNVSFRRLDGTVICSANAAPLTPGKARAQCATTQTVSSRAVVVTTSSPTYTGPADVGVFTVANSGTGFASAAAGTGVRAFGFQARPVKKAPPSGNVVVVVPTVGGLAVVESATLTALTTSCAGNPKVCAGGLAAGPATVRVVDLTTGTVGPVLGSATVQLDVRDLAEVPGGTDTWASSLGGAVVDVFGTPASQQAIGYGGIAVTP